MKVVPTGTEQTHLNFSRAAGVVFFYGDLVLLSKRITSYKGEAVAYPGYWSPFAGTVEERESPIAAAAREVFEESGKEIKPYFLTYLTEIPRDEGVFVLYAYELNKLFHPELNFEHTEYGYFKIDSLHASPCPICPQIVAAIQDFDKHRRFKV